MTITLKTLPLATAQEVFDQCALHLLTQNKKSESSHGECRYHLGPLRCAAGCFIADDEYATSMESYPWRYFVGTNRIPEAHADLIGRLQMVHDAVEVHDWPVELASVANNEYLAIPAFLQAAL